MSQLAHSGVMTFLFDDARHTIVVVSINHRAHIYRTR